MRRLVVLFLIFFAVEQRGRQRKWIFSRLWGDIAVQYRADQFYIKARPLSGEDSFEQGEGINLADASRRSLFRIMEGMAATPESSFISIFRLRTNRTVRCMTS